MKQVTFVICLYTPIPISQRLHHTHNTPRTFILNEDNEIYYVFWREILHWLSYWGNSVGWEGLTVGSASQPVCLVSYSCVSLKGQILTLKRESLPSGLVLQNLAVNINLQVVLKCVLHNQTLSHMRVWPTLMFVAWGRFLASILCKLAFIYVNLCILCVNCVGTCWWWIAGLTRPSCGLISASTYIYK